MKRFYFPLLALVISSVSLFLLLSRCSGSKDSVSVNSDNPKFAEFIAAYTGGVISIEDPIRIQMMNGLQIDESDVKEAFSIQPAVKGDAYLKDARTIEFLPDEYLESNQEYTVQLDLKKLVDVPGELSQFIFKFSTRPLTYQMYIEGVHAPDYKDLTDLGIRGKMRFNDPVDTVKLKKMLVAGQHGKELPIEWSVLDNKNYDFNILNVSRGKKDSKVVINANGGSIGSFGNQSKVIQIPSLDRFKITDIKVRNLPEQMVEVHFSDPLSDDQDFYSYINLEGNSTYPQFSVVKEGFKLIVYPESRLMGTFDFKVYSGIQNHKGKKLNETANIEVSFEDLKPQVELLGEGNILPSTQSSHFPFKAVNLSAVDVKISKIYEDNVLQFLQVNELGGGYQLTRVGREIYEGTVPLDQEGKLNLNQWNQFSFDLSKFIEVEQGAIYRVELNIDKKYSVYPCDEDKNENKDNNLQEIQVTYEEPWNEKGWGEYYYDYDYYSDYNYRDREDPCTPSYYYHKSWSRNILISDIGMIAKAGKDKEMEIYLTHLNSLAPLSGCKVKFYDYQQQLLATTESDAQGKVKTFLKNKPFVAVADYHGQKGYLKLMDQNSNSLSKFEVSGEVVQQGMKGFIYTERGVWRPGDSIYVSFILEDSRGKLPNNHPVIFEMFDPQGNLIKKNTSSYKKQGIFDFRTATSMDATTGSYKVNVRIGNQVYAKYLRVETVKPNRLKIQLQAANGADELYFGEDQKVKLQVNWLHGAPANGLRAKVNANFVTAKADFKGYKDFVFEDPTKKLSSKDRVVYDARISEEGSAEFTPQWENNNTAPGKIKAFLNTRVFEEGGEFSIDRQSIVLSPYSSYVGMRVPKGTLYGNTLVTDQDHKVELVHLTEKGKPQKTTFEVTVYELQWRWWWDSYNSDLSSYITSSSAKVVDRKSISASNGKASYNFKINRPSWGRYLIHVKNRVSGHSTGQIVYVDWPYEARANRKNQENETMLAFSTDKEVYEKGEEVELSIPSPSNGKVLVSIENGTKVIQSFWKETKKGETKVRFKTDGEMAPNAYVHVTLLQPYEKTTNDLPIRMYGVVPIQVEDPNTHLAPTITCNDVFKPESETVIRVGEENGRKMTYTLAIVDDGLLDLTNFQTPDPWSRFYAKEALGVKTWDMYDEVIRSYGDQLDQLLAVGGDGEAAEVKNGHKANRFKPMVQFYGPFEASGFGMNTHKIEIPNYVGSVRVMVIASNPDERAYGNTDKTVAVRSPLMVLGTLPRVLTPGEKISLPVTVFAMEDKVKSAKITVKTDQNLKLKGASSQTVKFKRPGDQVIYFDTEVPEKTGITKVQIIAEGNGEKATYEMELDLRYPNPEVSEVEDYVLQPGESIDVDAHFPGINGTNKGVVQLASFPAIDFGERIKYLVDYPHGCLEQTVSRAFPQLYISKVTKLNASFDQRMKENVEMGLKKLANFQKYDGGFTYWPGSSYYNNWATSYAGHFMLSAELEGFSVSSGMKNKWISFQKQLSRSWVMPTKKSYYGGADIDQAYRLYTLALAKSPDLSAMNRLRETNGISSASKWRLAAAYALIGQKRAAKELIESAGMNIGTYDYSYTYGSAIRDQAMMLETVILLGDDKKAQRLAKQVADGINSSRWHSTQTTAMALIGLSKYLKDIHQGGVMKYAVEAGSLSKNTTSSEPLVQHAFNEQTKKVKVTNKSQQTLFVNISYSGIPDAQPRPGSSENMKVDVYYKNMDGRVVDEKSLTQGTDFYAEVSVFNPASNGRVQDVALEQMFPSGWEILTSRLDQFDSMNKGVYDYQDIRDDRVYTYFSIRSGERKTFKVKLNAAYAGSYYLPAVKVGAMYDNGITATTASDFVDVLKRKGEAL